MAGTGNKIEDFGVGYFTKYGDGGVDISPIGSFLKSEVYQIAKAFDIPESIQKAVPTDGLWPGSPSDEERMGILYKDLEEAMGFCEKYHIETVNDFNEGFHHFTMGPDRYKNIEKYLSMHEKSRHKMEMPPVFKLGG